MTEPAIAEILEYYQLRGEWPSQKQWARTYNHSQMYFRRRGGIVFEDALSIAQKQVEFEAPELPDGELGIEELLERRENEYQRKAEYEEARKAVPVKVNISGPVGILHFGDPHIDDLGSDMRTLREHRQLVLNTPGLMAANVGDSTNNWIGRLARLYGEQETTAMQSIQLLEWFIADVPWLYLVSGNHDCWAGHNDPFRWIVSKQHSVAAKTQIRLRLTFPKGRDCVVNARHDFPGHSMWNLAHGPMKAAQMGWRDDILTCGHRHCSGYGILKSPADGRLSHCIRIASYKRYDEYAKGKGLPDQNISPAVVTVINPLADRESDFVTVFHDVFRGADYLTYLRKQEVA